MKWFSIMDKKGVIKENYFYEFNLKNYLSKEELKRLAYELTPILRRRKRDLHIYSFTLNTGAILQVGFRSLVKIDYEIFLIAHIPASLKSFFNKSDLAKKA